MIIHKPTLDKVREWAKQTHGFQRTVLGIADAPSAVEKLELTLAFRYIRINSGQLEMRDTDNDLMEADILELSTEERIVEFIKHSKTPVSTDVIMCFSPDFKLPSTKYSGLNELFKNQQTYLFFGTFPGYDTSAEKHEIRVKERKAKIGRATSKPTRKRLNSSGNIKRKTLVDKIKEYLVTNNISTITKKELQLAVNGSRGTFQRACKNLIDKGFVSEVFKIQTGERFLLREDGQGTPHGFTKERIKACRKDKFGELVRHYKSGEVAVIKTQMSTIYNTGVVLLHKRRYSILELKQIITDAKCEGIESIEIQEVNSWKARDGK